jgi:multidrug resistance efflux pump
MDKKDAYVEKLQSQLKEWSIEIDRLKAKADVAKADAQLEYHKRVEELRAMHGKASKKLDELKAASDGAWDDLKTGADASWDALSNAIKSALAHFK